MKIKICGITNSEDAQAAVEAGADAIGFVFYKNSPRFVAPKIAKQIIAQLPPFVLPVGVFVNEAIETTRNLIDECGLVLAQLHGDETPSYCETLARPLLRGIRLRDHGSFLSMAEYQGRFNVKGFVIDAFSDTAYGGTGKVVDWNLAAKAAKSLPILLAGGLTPENVQDAIHCVQPYGVDVSSGVEVHPGKKDPAKILAFIHAVRCVSTE
ncbi:MAG: phosphoribosylanthranilate isomerase [Nitrospirales bacterium]|nr:phosphoribosylanthranilate isomerase [Nitrospirales bacterium]